MKNGRTLGESRRFRQLEPVIRRTFDIPTMVRLSVSPSWANLTEARPRGHGKEGQRRFVHDSPLEGDGFELPVPREKKSRNLGIPLEFN